MRFRQSLAQHAWGRWVTCLLLTSLISHWPSANGQMVKTSTFSDEISKRVQTRLTLANAYLQAGMGAIAFEEVDKALLLAPHSPAALSFKAILYQQQQRFDLAESHFNKATELAPNAPEIAHNFGVFLCQMGQFELSFAKFQTAVSQSMGLSRDRTEWVWGQCLVKNEQLDAANERMTLALTRQPEFILMAEPLVAVKIALHRFEEAEKITDKLNDSPSVSAQSLWLGMQLAERQNNQDKKKQWAKMLGQLFSTSKQWQQHQEGQLHE
jgi:type IV pilus assembly protein PilF